MATLSFIAGYAEPSTPEDDFDDFGVQYDEDEGIHDQKQGLQDGVVETDDYDEDGQVRSEEEQQMVDWYDRESGEEEDGADQEEEEEEEEEEVPTKGSRWSEQEIARLLETRQAHPRWTYQQLSGKFPGRTAGACKGRLKRCKEQQLVGNEKEGEGDTDYLSDGRDSDDTTSNASDDEVKRVVKRKRTSDQSKKATNGKTVVAATNKKVASFRKSMLQYQSKIKAAQSDAFEELLSKGLIKGVAPPKKRKSWRE